MREKTLDFILWLILFLVLFFVAFLLFFSCAHAQDDTDGPKPGADYAEGADSDLGQPFDMPNPDTGESGTWIPRWVEREHLFDAHKLQTCQKTAAFFELQLEAVAQRNDAMDDVLYETEQSRDAARLETSRAYKRLVKAESQLERRMRVVWGLVGASVGLLGTTAILVLR